MPTAIEWTDESWNPMTGCTKISAGCDNCYAHVVAHRRTRDVYLRQLPVKDTPSNRADPFAPRFWEDRLMLPFSWREPRRVFVNSMSDVFHAHFSLEQIQRTLDAFGQRKFGLLELEMTGLDIRKIEDVELAADFLRKQWKLGIDPIPLMAELLEEKGIKVVALDLPETVSGSKAFVKCAIMTSSLIMLLQLLM